MAVLPPVESQTVGAIYAAYKRQRQEDERGYLGASTFGQECDRALWYGFRWAHAPEALTGRKIRLFETGHREEARLIADLRRAGIEVTEGEAGTREQFAVSSLGGHLRGHLDAIATNVPEAPKTPHVVECKTHNEKSFKALVKDGVQRSKPGHYAQMMLYMHLRGLPRALYVAVNKNTDELHVERVRYDALAAARLMARAESIIGAARAPSKLHDDPQSSAAFACVWCPARHVCHEGEFVRVNCRTCLHATPIIDDGDAARWRCERHGRDLTLAEQRKGCPDHLYIPDFVPGEQLDASEEGNWVDYRLPDGSLWCDGGRA